MIFSSSCSDVSLSTVKYIYIYIVTVLLLIEILDWAQLFPWIENECQLSRFAYGYSFRNGPHTWKVLYPASNGSNQSPINITTRLAVVVQPSEPLRWTGYNKGPLSMTIANNGNNGAISFIDLYERNNGLHISCRKLTQYTT